MVVFHLKAQERYLFAGQPENIMDPAYQVNFSTESLLVLNIILGLILFGIAIDLDKKEFRVLINKPRSAFAGLIAHFILLPFLTFLLALLLQPPPEIALGMILVAACPGGNMANMFSYLAKANTALSVALTSVSHLLAIVLAPINFAFYGSMLPGTKPLLQHIKLDVAETMLTVSMVIVLPLIAGISLATLKPIWAEKIKPYMKKIALLAFAIFLLAAIIGNKALFLKNMNTVFPIVILHNALALLGGYSMAKLMRLPEQDARTISFETGVQNAGLGLVLIFNFFDGMGGMAVVAALWGVWHLVSGGILAGYWSKK